MTEIINDLQDMRYLQWTRTRKSSGTAGSFLKSYDDTGERKLYYKLSDYDSLKGITGHECVNEIVAQRLLTLMNIPHLEYRLIHALVDIEDHTYDTYLCESYDFKNRDEAKITLEDYYEMERIPGETPIEFCKRMGWEKYIFSMLTIDFLIHNRDRHGANIEVLFDRKERSVRPAPLFDHGVSFLCRCGSKEEISGFDVMSDLKVQSFVGTNSAFDNIRLVKPSFFETVRKINDSDREYVVSGLECVLSIEHIDKIWEMIRRRQDYIDNLRNT